MSYMIRLLIDGCEHSWWEGRLVGTQAGWGSRPVVTMATSGLCFVLPVSEQEGCPKQLSLDRPQTLQSLSFSRSFHGNAFLYIATHPRPQSQNQPSSCGLVPYPVSLSSLAPHPGLLHVGCKSEWSLGSFTDSDIQHIFVVRLFWQRTDPALSS